MIDRRCFLVLSAVGAAGLVGACSSRNATPTATSSAPGKPVEVAFTAAESDVDLGGVAVRTWTYTGTVPATEIRLRKGQRLRVPVTNRLPQETTVHWHGLAIPNDMDGVPVLTQQAIAPGSNFTYEFVVPDAGTYYLHSHVGTQLDRGMYGPLIIEDPADGADYDDELVVVLDDWIDGTGTNPDQVAENLKINGMRPMAGGGPMVTPTMPLGDDGGDVTYPYFLVNGRTTKDPQIVDYRSGQRVRLRIINAGADTAFRVAVPGCELDVTHTDGYPMHRHRTETVILGMGERADAIVTLTSSVPLIAAAEGKDGHAQLNLRVDAKSSSPDVAGLVKTLRTQQPLNTATLTPAAEVVLPQRNPDQIVELRLAGPMAGYTWPINGKLYDPPNNGIGLTKDKRVRIRFVSDSMMFHPMHLHGHTFQVVGPQGPRARKDTVLVPPGQTVEVDFDTDNPGRWIVHCHNDYHLGGGMATFFAYDA
ncbi:multicopper oxidase family protein [Mycobacterium sp. 141]|uniref:multicopper oxidase family protein n=1 Tax=Mycobacterium sp. 141 TaxID=1120797 RepID=UPI0003648E88|nr:multicopper oxidase family protein [Mycobacterium sp. 141]